MRVFVLDQHRQPLMPCRSARARELLRAGKAVVLRRYPFTIMLKTREGGDVQPISLNVDPGSKTTGIALVAEFESGRKAIFGLHIEHRSLTIKSSLESRSAIRRSRRHRKTRYRAPRFENRTRRKGWLPPSLQSRVDQVGSWTQRLTRLAPITQAQIETVRFDMQLMQNASISGVEYQQGTLMGYEVREYLFQRHRHQCAYCDGLSGDPVLEAEHVVPRKLHGPNRVNNLVVACWTCNNAKGCLHPRDWADQCRGRKTKLDQRRAANMDRILVGYRPSLRDAAAVNATRYAVGDAIKALVPEVSFWSGGRTKKNRVAQGYAKDHWIDAACVGGTGDRVSLEPKTALVARAQGQGSRQMCRMDRFGFPRTSAKSARTVKGFRTGDLVKAIVPAGKKQGIHVGRVAVRASGSFNITHTETVQGISHRHCRLLMRSDGYRYSFTKIATNSGGCGKQAA